ncbi:hypothetical protein PR001_g5270 [Phytophthora rubi]|uniref:MSP domain-containing protein n=1 Tax=Phytophthora rubi TaxID=129364 RepID=A0A6A3N5Y4_9STRA|nr:hypothetical protein PR002_g5705 [Phytophthora rubi]KAE9044674.1 hypothetical protein PR001_g5270 [Phytophthora rubi]
MPTPPRTQMASYLERWEEQKAQSRLERQRTQRRRSSGVGDELSFISAIERETAQHEPYQADADVLSGQYEEEGDDSFNLPVMDAFPSSELAEHVQEQQKMPADDEFVDAATFLKNNELGGEDSFSEDVGPVTGDNWDQVESSGRPSDFFERKSRNLDHVKLSSPRNVDDPMLEGDITEDEGDDLGLCTPKKLSPTGARQGVAMHDHFNGSPGLSGSGTAFSSGYDVHFDNTKLMYTPNSLKYLQEKSRFRSASEVRNDSESDLSVADHTGEAMAVTKKAPSVSDQEIEADPSPEYVANLQRGPGVIKESLDEIDALIENSIRLASAPPAKDPLGVELSEDMREFVRDYERPLESMLPLSRTTDSWEEDAMIDDDTTCSRRSRDLDRLSSGTETGRRATSGVRRSRSQEMPELDTIREVPCPSNINSASQSQRSNDSRIRVSKAPQIQNGLVSPTDPSDQGRRARKADQLSVKRFSGINSKRSEGLKSRATSVTLDQSLADVAATQNPFRDEAYHPETNGIGYGSADDDIHNVGGYYDRHGDNESCVNGKATPDQYAASKSGEPDLNGASFHYRESTPVVLRSLPKKKPMDDQRRGMNSFESRSTAVQKQPAPSDRFLDVMERNTLHVTMEAAMIPRRCRRFLCSIGDIMTEQIVFTNGTNSVGRICVSLLPLSTGCQQFSVSPAVLELGPNASNAFHVTFNARQREAAYGAGGTKERKSHSIVQGNRYQRTCPGTAS